MKSSKPRLIRIGINIIERPASVNLFFHVDGDPVLAVDADAVSAQLGNLLDLPDVAAGNVHQRSARDVSAAAVEGAQHPDLRVPDGLGQLAQDRHRLGQHDGKGNRRP